MLTRVVAAVSLLVLTATAHAALTRGEKAAARKEIRANAKAAGMYPAGSHPSLRVRFADNGNGTHTATADTLTKQAAWPTFQLQRRVLATATFDVTQSLLTISPPPPPTVTQRTRWAPRMYALGSGN